MDERRKVWRAHILERFSDKDGISILCHYGYVSPCGGWIEAGDTRWRLTAEWCETEAEARAVLAPKIAEIGARLCRQAAELLQAGRPQEVLL